MKIGLIKRITKQDLRASDLPKWVDNLLTPLNQFITTTVTALTSRLTFEDNFSAKVLSFKVVHNEELEINPQRGNLRVIGVLPSSAGGAIITGFGWSQKADGKIGITFLFSDSGEHTCKLIILLGA